MSYIRCLSNPECLYIWSDGQRVHVSHNVKPPHSSGRAFTIPDGAFNACTRKWNRWLDPAKSGDVVAQEVNVDRRTGEAIPDWKLCPRCKEVPRKRGKIQSWSPCRKCSRQHMRDAKRGDFRIRLSYKDDFVNLWRVTWEYVCSHERRS